MSKLEYTAINDTIDVAASVIAKEIDADGCVRCVSGIASDDPSMVVRNTSFFTSLVLGAIQGMSNERYAEIIKRCSGFLLTQRQTDGSYNYWRVGSSESVAYACPNDLDDTALATGALWRMHPNSVSGEELAHVTKLLIRSEQQSGGPYRTWFTDDQAWQDVDVAVNANVAWMLASQQVVLPGLESYVAEQLTSDMVGSKYYCNREMLYYFISRIGIAKEALKAIVSEEFDVICASGNVLRIACLLCALLYCEADAPTIDTVAHALYDAIQKSGFRADPICYDLTSEKSQSCAGSEAVTAAIAVEALQLYLNRFFGKGHSEEDLYATYFHNLKNEFLAKQPNILAGQIQELFQHILEKDGVGEIQRMAYECSMLFHTDLQMPMKNLVSLGFASLLGWTAYSVYDDVMDEQSNIGMLPAAHVCVREMQAIYRSMGHSDSDAVIDSIFIAMDNAHAIEFLDRTTKAPVQALNWMLVADRSIGHSLGVLVQAMHAGYAVTSAEFQAILSWFRHYITAKQLHDDAHDWEEDIARNALTYPVRMLLDIPSVRRKEYFLMECMPDLAYRILDELEQADAALAGNALYPQALLKFSERLRRGAFHALHQSHEIQAFIKSMELQKAVC